MPRSASQPASRSPFQPTSRTSTRARPANVCGTALLEGLLALLILTLGIAALASVASHGIRDNRSAGHVARANRLLHDGAEQRRLHPESFAPQAWRVEVAAALPLGEGSGTADTLAVEWREPATTGSSRLTLSLAP